MANVFNDDRVYFPEDPEMQLLGNREKLAQWRHRMCGPAFTLQCRFTEPDFRCAYEILN